MGHNGHALATLEVDSSDRDRMTKHHDDNELREATRQAVVIATAVVVVSRWVKKRETRWESNRGPVVRKDRQNKN